MPKHYSLTLDTDLYFDTTAKNGKPRYYYLGEPVPGVTTVIDSQTPQLWMKFWVKNTIGDYLEENLPAGVALTIIEKNDLIEAAKASPEDISQKAKDIGTQAHKWIEGHIKYKLGHKTDIEFEMPEDPRALNSINAFLRWEDANNVIYVSSEKRVYSKKRKVAGTADILAKVNGKLTLIDIKTAAGIYPEHFVQASAYADIIQEMEEPKKTKVEEIHIIRIGKNDGEFHQEIVSDMKLRSRLVERFNLSVKGYYLDKMVRGLLPKPPKKVSASDIPAVAL